MYWFLLLFLLCCTLVQYGHGFNNSRDHNKLSKLSPSHRFTKIIQCFPGFYINEQGKCESCAPGYYSEKANLNYCMSCPRGTFNNNYGTAYCTRCLPGTFNPHTGRTECINCSDGYYQPYTGSSECIQCPPDTYNSETTGREACFPTITNPIELSQQHL